MTSYVLLAAGLIGLSYTITYAWWCRFRIWVLRQDLFEIRDRLWDDARKGGFLGHPAHREARDAINAMIRFCPRLSLPVWRELNVISKGRKRVARSGLVPAVDQAMMRVAHRITRFVFLESAYGLLYVAYCLFRHGAKTPIRALAGSVRKELHRKEPASRRIALSEQMVEIDREYQIVSREPAVC